MICNIEYVAAGDNALTFTVNGQPATAEQRALMLRVLRDDTNVRQAIIRALVAIAQEKRQR